LDLKEKIAAGDCLFGTHITCCDMTTVEVMGNCSFDYLWIDMEHSPIDKGDIQNHLTAARACKPPVATFIRVPWNDPVIIKPLLDMGPAGIVFPMISTPQDVDNAVRACRYPPEGIRGYSPRAALRYGLDDAQQYIKESSRNIWVICQIETMHAYQNLDALLECDGVDAFVIGPNDLSGQLGKLANPMAPEVDRVITDIVRRVRRVGKPCGISVGAYDQQSIRHWLSKGINMISCGGDVTFMRTGSLLALKNLRTVKQELGKAATL